VLLARATRRQHATTLARLPREFAWRVVAQSRGMRSSILFAIVSLTLVIAACGDFDIYAETCNDRECCARSCCTKADNWCVGAPQCSSDSDCVFQTNTCISGVCKARFPTCYEDACCAPGLTCATGAGQDWGQAFCTPRCDDAHPCPAGYGCSVGSCTVSLAPLAPCATGTVNVFGRCATPCANGACPPGLTCIAGGCFLDHPRLAVCASPGDGGADSDSDADR
jgi:hypothetical protein